MRTILLTSVLTAGAITLLSDQVLAHGGQYRGPADTVPPSAGGGGRPGGPSGPTTGGPAGPSAPRPGAPSTGGGGPSSGGSGPSSGGPTNPSGRGPTSGGRSGGLEPDLTTWDFWWEFNKDPYLRLKDAVHRGAVQTGSDDFYLGRRRRDEAANSQKPTRDQVLGEILPALKKAIDSTDQRDITSSCMVAMAKIGTDHPTFRLVDVFAPRLRRGDQEVRETAALALGIAAIDGTEELDLLVGLALDNNHGRTASGGSVNDRTRSFAIYGLGLLAHEHTKTAVKAAAFAVLKQLIDNNQMSNRNIKVAAIQATSLLNIGDSTVDEKRLQSEVLQCLDDYYSQELGASGQLIAAHCPTAIAKLIGRNHANSESYRARFAADLQGKAKNARSSHDIARSCAIALGQMTRANDDATSPDAKYSELLLDTYLNHRDHQTRYFAVLALGQIGGAQNRAVLEKSLRSAKGLDKPWCALALGVYSFALYEAQPTHMFAQDRVVGDLLFEQFKEARDPNIVSACAIALGLNRHREAASSMRERLADEAAKQDQAGYICIGLALMEDRGSVGHIRDVLEHSTRRTDLLKQAAVALGRLGDKDAADYLRRRLAAHGSNLASLSAIASALGFIGDRRSIAPLTKMLFDQELGELPRAFAAVALGGIADRASLPWNSKIGVNTNYRANVETLTNQQSGILDIL